MLDAMLIVVLWVILNFQYPILAFCSIPALLVIYHVGSLLSASRDWDLQFSMAWNVLSGSFSPLFDVSANTDDTELSPSSATSYIFLLLLLKKKNTPLRLPHPKLNCVIDFLIPSQVTLASLKNPYGLLFFFSLYVPNSSTSGGDY